MFEITPLDTHEHCRTRTGSEAPRPPVLLQHTARAAEDYRLRQDILAGKRLRREVQAAREVQTSFLPAQLPAVPGYAFFAHYRAAHELGGDVYNFLAMPSGQLAILVGDVAGKGVAAALLMARLSADVEHCLLAEPDPALAVTRLNERWHQSGVADRFVTLVLALLDVDRHGLTLVNAGHPPPVVRRAGRGEVEEVAGGEVAGLPLGVDGAYQYGSCRLDLLPGDCVLLYTDGISEAPGPDDKLFGREQLLAALRAGSSTPTLLGEHLLETLDRHRAGPQHDDITLVSFGRIG